MAPLSKQKYLLATARSYCTISQLLSGAMEDCFEFCFIRLASLWNIVCNFVVNFNEEFSLCWCFYCAAELPAQVSSRGHKWKVAVLFPW